MSVQSPPIDRQVIGILKPTLQQQYLPVFIIAASAYLVALLMVHLLSPRLEPAPIK